MSRFAIQPPGILLGILLIEIGLEFGYSVGFIGQIRTAASLVAAIAALLMSVLSIRFNNKLLLLLGLFFIGISALGSFLALNFPILLIAFAISGIGTAMAGPMAISMVGAHIPREKRAGAIGWLMTGGALGFLIGAPIIGAIAGIGGWRLAFLGFVLPIPFLNLVMVAKGVPSTDQSFQSSENKGPLVKVFKEVVSNHSANACFIGTSLALAAEQAILFYGVSYFRERFLIPVGYASLILVSGAIFVILGNLVSGRVINQFGRKSVAVLTSAVEGILIIAFMNMPNLWLALALMLLIGVLSGMRNTSTNSLTLEQIPKFRGTMMSLSSVAAYMGTAYGASVGGLALLWLGYEGVGLALGAMGLAAAIIIFLLVRDPTNTESSR